MNSAAKVNQAHRRLGASLAVILLFGTGFALSRSVDIEVTIETKTRGVRGGYVPAHQRIEGPQIVMLYFGSAGCGWSNHPELPNAVEALKLRLADHAAGRGASFKAVGIALDWSPVDGLRHLATLGHFDEISAGYNWGNTLALRYLWSLNTLMPATPQIVVYQRIVEATAMGDHLYYGESARQIICTATGVEAIREWSTSLSPEPCPPQHRVSLAS